MVGRQSKDSGTALRAICKVGSTLKVSPHAVMRALLLTEESSAIPLFLIVMDILGQEALEWAPESIKLSLEEEFKIELPRESLDKIMMAIMVVTTNYFYKDVRRFIDACNVFAGGDFSPGVFDPADADEILNGVTEAMLLWPPEEGDPDSEFSSEIQEYVKQVLSLDGIAKPSDLLSAIFSGDQSGKVDSDWADDPVMYASIYDSQISRQSEMETTYIENLEATKQQLSLLQLQNGDTREVVSNIQRIIQRRQLPTT